MTYDAEVLADAPEAYWRLGEAAGGTAADSSGNSHDLTHVNSPTLGVTGLLTNDANLAIAYPGTNEHSTRTSFTGIAGATELTIEFWMQKSTFPPDNDAILGYNSTTVENELQLLHTPGGFLRWFIGNSPIDTPVNLVDGLRHHVVFRWRSSDGRAQMFVDGALRFNTTHQTSYTFTGNGDIFLAAEPDGLSPAGVPGQYWQGTLDEFAIYTSYLSTGRIVDHYNAGLDTLANPFIRRVELAEVGIGGAARYHPDAVFYVPLDEPQGSGTVTDVIGGKTGTVTVAGVGADLGVAAQVGTGINFVGTDQDRVAFAANADFGVFGKAGFTIEAWVYLRSLGGSFPRLAANENAAGTVGWRASFDTVGSGYNISLVVNGDSGTYDARGASGELSFNAWHHIVLAWDSTSDLVEVFIDGLPNQVSQVAGVGAPVDDTGQPMHIGESPGAAVNRNPDGVIDNFAIYHRALDQREALSSYVRGRNRKPLQDILEPPPANHWKFRDNALDSEGAGDLTLVNGAGIQLVSGRYGLFFDEASSQYASIPSSVVTNMSGESVITVEGWVYLGSAGSTGLHFFCRPTRVNGDFGSSVFYLRANKFTSTYNLQWAALPTAGDTNNAIIASQAFTSSINRSTSGFDTWFHFAGVADAGNGRLKLYINGVLVDDVVASGWSPTFDGVFASDSSFGRSVAPSPDRYCEGGVSDWRIHYRELSAAEVVARYRANVDRFVVRTHFSREMDPTTTENPANWSTVPAVTFNDISLEPDGFYADFDISEIQGFEPVLYLTPGAVQGVSGDPLGGTGAVRIQQPSAFVSTPVIGVAEPFVPDPLSGDLIATPLEGPLPESRGFEVDVVKVYLMRAFKTTPTTGFVYWSADNAPDTGAAQAPVPPGELTDIVVEATYFRNP